MERKIIGGAILCDSVEISLCSELKTMNELIKKRITECGDNIKKKKKKKNCEVSAQPCLPSGPVCTNGR